MVIGTGRSTTTRFVVDMLSLIWGFGEKCTIVHCVTSQPASVSYNLLYKHFRQPLTDWLKFERGDFSTPGLERYGAVGVGDGPIR